MLEVPLGSDLDGLVDCSKRALSWLLENLLLFEPKDITYSDQMQPLGELALLYGLMSSWSGDRTTSTLLSLDNFLLNLLGEPRLAQYARKIPRQFSLYYTPYLGIRMAGHKMTIYEEGLDVLRRAGYPKAAEVPPFRQMEWPYFTWKAGLLTHRPKCTTAYACTTLKCCRTPVYLNILDVYSITHTLFYQTDFAGPAADIPLSERERIVPLLEVLLLHFWRKANWDLVAELLLNLLSLDQSNTPFFSLAVSALVSAWREDGLLPGPTFAPVPKPDIHYLFRHCYHTTLVGVLLCAAWVYRRTSSLDHLVHVSNP
jgi:hypothetical protein